MQSVRHCASRSGEKALQNIGFSHQEKNSKASCAEGRDCRFRKVDLMLTNRLVRRLFQYGKQLPSERRQRIKDRALEIQIGPFAWLADLPCALLFGRNLKALATIYGSDKWNQHWYAQHYENVFKQVRRKKMNIVEIGIGGWDNPRLGGGSLRMWRTYFPNSKVYGVDIYDKSPHDRLRIKTFRGSQTDSVFLESLVSRIGNIDIFIDDGSHKNGDVLFTFQHMFPHLVDGGFYVIEDTLTSYLPDYDGNANDRNDPHTILGYFKSLTDGLNWEEFTNHGDPSFLDLNIKSITFYHNLIILTKGSELPPSKA
jgi:hypothetical protein